MKKHALGWSLINANCKSKIQQRYEYCWFFLLKFECTLIMEIYLRSTNFRGYLFSRVKKIVFRGITFRELKKLWFFASINFRELVIFRIFARINFRCRRLLIKKCNFINFAVYKKPSVRSRDIRDMFRKKNKRCDAVATD